MSTTQRYNQQIIGFLTRANNIIAPKHISSYYFDGSFHSVNMGDVILNLLQNAYIEYTKDSPQDLNCLIELIVNGKAEVTLFIDTNKEKFSDVITWQTSNRELAFQLINIYNEVLSERS